MMSGFGWAALALLFAYLSLFFWGSAVAAQAAGRPVWLFARATGRDRLAAIGFRASFALAFFGPLLWLALPMLHKLSKGKGKTNKFGQDGIAALVLTPTRELAAQVLSLIHI